MVGHGEDDEFCGLGGGVSCRLQCPMAFGSGEWLVHRTLTCYLAAGVEMGGEVPWGLGLGIGAEQNVGDFWDTMKIAKLQIMGIENLP